MTNLTLACAALLIVLLVFPAIAESITKSVHLRDTGAEMEMTLSDHSIEVKDANGGLFARGKWDEVTDTFTGDVFGDCPMPVIGTVDYNGMLVMFGQQPTCGSDPARLRMLRFVGPPNRTPAPVEKKKTTVKKPVKKKSVVRRTRPQQAPQQQPFFWYWPQR